MIGVDCVGLGGDFLKQISQTLGSGEHVVDGVEVDSTLEGLEGRASTPSARALRARGFGGDVEAIAGGNLLRFLATSPCLASLSGGRGALAFQQ